MVLGDVSTSWLEAVVTRQTVGAQESRAIAEAARETEWRKPSFAKELFLGRLRLDLIHPHPRPTSHDKQKGEEFLGRLRAFLETEVDAAAIEREARIPDQLIKGLKDLGALGMQVPEQYGGLGLSKLYYTRALQLVGSVNPALGALLSAHQSIGVPQPVKLFGTPEQKQRYLPRCARTDISAFLLTEPDVGSDPARLQTSAAPTDDGSAYILNGVKLWGTNGVIADLLVVMAKVPRSDGHRGGITAFVVEANSPGITVENRNAFLGLRGIENSVTRFHDVRVPAESVVGHEGQGLKIALTTLNAGRLSLPALCAGGGKWCLNIAREWSAAREQWGRPIGGHEAISDKLAFIAATSYALDAVLELSSMLADDDRNDIRIEAALAKLYGSEMAWKMADELLQVRGGRGYETAASLTARGEKAVPVEQMLRDLRINRIFEGSTEIMHLLIAREAVDTHLAVGGDIIDKSAPMKRRARAAVRAGVFYAGWLPKLAVGEGQLPSSYTEFGRLARHLRYIERSSRRLARSTFYGMSRWQGRLEYRQVFLGRIVDIGAELYAMSAACVRAQMLRDDDPEQGVLAAELADAFCTQARIRADALFHGLWRNADATNRRLAKHVIERRYSWAEAGVLLLDDDAPWIADTTLGPSTAGNLHRRIP
jgi:alkylation response protein AidB-like acyl-CoA dehydrogenase